MSEIVKEFDIKKAQDNLATLVNCWEPFQFIMISDSYVYGVSQTARVEPNDATIYQIDNNGEIMGKMLLVGRQCWVISILTLEMLIYQCF